MSVQTASPAAAPRRPAGRRALLVAGVTALALLLAGGGAWLVSQRGSDDIAATVAPAAGGASTAATAGDEAGDAVQAAPKPADHNPTIYMVASQAQADALRQAFYAGGASLAQPGDLLPSSDFVVVTTADDELRLRQGLAEADAARAADGLPGIQIVDLRPGVVP